MPSDTSLSFVVTANAEQFESVMQNVQKRTQTFEKQQATVSASVSASSKRSAMALMEIGRGAEDFMAGFSTGGIAGGMRAVTNNIGQLASILSPATAGFVMLGTAVASAALPSLLKYATASEDAAERTKRLKEQTDAVMDSITKRISKEQELASISRMGSIEGVQGRMDDVDTALAADRAKFDAVSEQILARQNAQDAIMKKFGDLGPGIMARGYATSADIGLISSRGGMDGATWGRALPSNIADNISRYKKLEEEAQNLLKDRAVVQDNITTSMKQQEALQGRLNTLSQQGQQGFAAAWGMPQIVPLGDQSSMEQMQQAGQEALRRRQQATLQEDLGILEAEQEVERLQQSLSPQRGGGRGPSTDMTPKMVELIQKQIEVAQQNLAELKRLREENRSNGTFIGVSE